MTTGVQMRMSPAQLMAEARRRTGIVIVDDEVIEPLEVMIASMNAESRSSSGMVVWKNVLMTMTL